MSGKKPPRGNTLDLLALLWCPVWVFPQMKGSVLFILQEKSRLWAECQGSKKDSFTLMVPLPLYPWGLEGAQRQLWAGVGPSSQDDDTPAAEACVCLPPIPAPGTWECTMPLQRLSRQTLGIQAAWKIKIRAQGISLEPLLCFHCVSLGRGWSSYSSTIVLSPSRAPPHPPSPHSHP